MQVCLTLRWTYAFWVNMIQERNLDCLQSATLHVVMQTWYHAHHDVPTAMHHGCECPAKFPEYRVCSYSTRGETQLTA